MTGVQTCALPIYSAQLEDAEIKSAFSYDEEELEKAKYKLYKKLKQDKVRLDFRISVISE